jgi:hypothetical protein
MSIIMAFELDTQDPSIRKNMPFVNDGAYHIPKVLDQLDELASGQHFAPISQFICPDTDTMEEMLDALDDDGEDTSKYGEELARARSLQDGWYNPRDALPSFQAIKSHLDSDPAYLQKLAKTDRFLVVDDLLEEIRGFIESLVYLDSRGVKFRFDLG